MDKFKVDVVNYGEFEVEEGTNLLELSRMVFGSEHQRYLGARINNQIFQLNKPIKKGTEIRFLDNHDVDGYRIYTKTITAVFIMAVKDLYKDANVSIEHFLGSGLYAELENNRSITFSKVAQIEAKMREIVEADIEIIRVDYPKDEAIKLFKDVGYEDKVRLFSSIDKEIVSVYKFNGQIDSFHGYLAPSTGYVKEFKLKYYFPGVLLLFPSRKNEYNMDSFKEQKS